MHGNIEIPMNMREEVFDDAASNIRRAQKRLKKNYDMRNKERAEFLEIGDIVVKRILVNVNRKGGKLAKQVSDDYFVVEDFMTNRNIVLRNMETNVLEKKSIPRDHLKKIHIENETNTNTSENTNENDDVPMETDEDMITNVSDITDDMMHNMMNNTNTNTHEIEDTLNNTQTNNQTVFTSDKEDVFLDDMNMLSPSQSPDVTIAKVTQSKGFIFSPLSLQSREEISPRLLITDFRAIQFENIGNCLTGKARGIHYVKGDGNCYF